MSPIEENITFEMIGRQFALEIMMALSVKLRSIRAK